VIIIMMFILRMEESGKGERERILKESKQLK
jgi:hypothetical protein